MRPEEKKPVSVIRPEGIEPISVVRAEEKELVLEEKEPVLHVFSNRSVLHNKAGHIETFDEGGQSPTAKARLDKIKAELEAGYLDKLIEQCKDPATLDAVTLDEEHLKTIARLVNSVTSEVGRAVVALTVVQLVIKSIAPEQSIRLHKGKGEAKGKGKAKVKVTAKTESDFSWKEGISMRVIDKHYITPALRHHDLIRMNADGVMMTRTLAENYPYTFLYKASISGAKAEWLQIIELVEIGSLHAENALKFLISLLLNKTAEFKQIATKTLSATGAYVARNPSFGESFDRIISFVNKSNYSARIFEVSIHSLFQVFDERKHLEGYLKPLSQMRSANKKHGNIGDIEITRTKGAFDIIEAWDAKYGKAYLREELEELSEKLESHPYAELAGFVTDQNPNMKDEIVSRIDDIAELHGTKIEILSFKDWVEAQLQRFDVAADADELGQEWVIALTESICQRRRDKAPIDEPTASWAETLFEVFTQ